MAAKPPVTKNHDIGAIWQTAIDQYEAITTFKLDSLASANSVEEILSEIRKEDTKFKVKRHDGSRVDRFRSLVSKSLRPIEVFSQITAEAASSCLSASIPHAVMPHKFQSANAVSADYDKIAGFFEDIDMYLHRLKILEEWVPGVPELELALTKVFTSVLALCGISAKFVKVNRMGNCRLSSVLA
ncbi:MAG: hypothetical protein Q9226_000154 [Calogaya cf. arnoldii]